MKNFKAQIMSNDDESEPYWQTVIAPTIRSATRIAAGVRDLRFSRVVMTRPGCGNGGLSWEGVRKALEPILDDRFIVVTPRGIHENQLHR